MELQQAIEIALDAQRQLRTRQGVNDPATMSKEMMRLAQATGAIELHLAELEKDYEVELSQLLHKYLVIEGTSATNAEKRVRIDLGERKGQLAYLTRFVASAWKQVRVIQSRYNHLAREAAGQI